MIKKTVKYVNFNGEEVVEDCYFNLSKAEVTEMELTVEGGYIKLLEDVVKSQDKRKILEAFKDLILKSYGVKSEDGRRFIKSEQLSEEFSQTEAFSEVFMDLATNSKSATAFVEGIIPSAPASQSMVAKAGL